MQLQPRSASMPHITPTTWRLRESPVGPLSPSPWRPQAVTVVNTVSGKAEVWVPSPVGMSLTGDNSSPHSLRITWTRGWYLCIECKMI
ncbi:hypothetical protein EYF80_048428 [Liparis tanakae]|uniref:Uncharacterized protein n=1 Tax=Liparis tanakae TaxID=230148 RepID=A0A4Z2FK94_9TELE|nr:hypothetical protein EYF80_048428 [Liparis tanakae]